MSIYQEYYDAQKELEKKYGQRSIVLMQVGSFYEAYGVNLLHSNPPIKIGHTEEISDILSMQIAYKNGRDKPHSKTNPQMVGFPDYALGNHLSKLLKAGYTIAIYDQFDGDSTKKDRKLVNIYSSSTYIDEDICEANALMVISIDSYKCPISKKMIEHAKCAIFDLKTGNINLTEIYNTATDNKKVETELYRLIHTFNPSEIVYCGTCDFNYDLEGRNIYKIPLQKVYHQTSYQNEFLSKIYGEQLIPPIEHLGLDKYSSLIPYLIHGLQYANEHDPLVISKIKPPTILDSDQKLILNNDSIYQLNLVDQYSSVYDFGNSKIRSLFGLLNKTRTAMGKRMLRSRLLMPITNIDELNRRYSLVSELLDCYDKYENELRGIADIELKYRKMATRKLHPYELAGLNDTFATIQSLFELAHETFTIDPLVISHFGEFYTEYLKTFNLDVLKESKLGSVKNSYFQPGVCEEVDKIQETITTNTNLLNELAQELSDQIDAKKNVSIDFNLNDKYHLKATSVRFKKISKKFTCTLSDNAIIKYDDLQVTTLKTTVKISSEYIAKKSKLIVKAQNNLAPMVNEQYFTILEKWCNKWGTLFTEIANLLAEIDCTMSSAKVAKEYGYVQPKFSAVQDRSVLVAKDLRHPIIEKIITKTKYVSNDFSIGNDSHYGTIIYGVNMSGKSSLLRSIGIAVVMAQAGMFVAAKSFEYSPFHNIMSKITVQDNHFKGQSLFMVEMDETNNMIRRANERTLILSDELCSSTETSSAHAIVASTLKKLSSNKVNFVFSTHLHELQNIPCIQTDLSIKIMHFKVEVGNGEWLFDRKLQEGGIRDTYGLEIAAALGLPKDFIADAFHIRNFLRNEKTEILSTKQSRYNKDTYMDRCLMCGIDKSLETHHILGQCTADKNGVIETKDGPIHKDQPFNLLVVCQDCHIRIHREKLGITIGPLKVKVPK
jgi:DNA mismatch repair protein MutS